MKINSFKIDNKTERHSDIKWNKQIEWKCEKTWNEISKMYISAADFKCFIQTKYRLSLCRLKKKYLVLSCLACAYWKKKNIIIIIYLCQRNKFLNLSKTSTSN